jgi:hypothetical protein
MIYLTAVGSTGGTAGTRRAELEHDRVKHCLRPARAAPTALRERASDHVPGASHPHIDQAITDFEAEVMALQARMRDLGAWSSIRVRRGRHAERIDGTRQ